jgi:hypothetical protein
VLEGARKSAVDHGLPADATDGLFTALVGAARDVQAEFVERPWTVEPLDLEREARPALARLSDPIVARAAEIARDPAPGGLDGGAIAGALDGSLAPPDARRAISQAVVALRPPVSDAPAADPQVAVAAPPPSTAIRATATRRIRRHRRRAAQRAKKARAHRRRRTHAGRTEPEENR